MENFFKFWLLFRFKTALSVVADWMCSMYSINSSPAPLQYTEKEGLRLGLVGWVKNTYSGTVVGQVQGPADRVEEMWVHTDDDKHVRGSNNLGQMLKSCWFLIYLWIIKAACSHMGLVLLQVEFLHWCDHVVVLTVSATRWRCSPSSTWRLSFCLISSLCRRFHSVQFEEKIWFDFLPHYRIINKSLNTSLHTVLSSLLSQC